MKCSHPDPPEQCLICLAPVVASINCVGACEEHLDDVFREAAMPITRLLEAANEAFGPGTSADVSS
jgi:hypothetical protein